MVNPSTVLNSNPNQPKKNFLSKLISKFGIYETTSNNNRDFINDNNVEQYNIFYKQIKSLVDLLNIKLNDERINKLESDDWIKLGREIILVLHDYSNSRKIFTLYAKNAVEYSAKLINTIKNSSKSIDRPQILTQIDLIMKSLSQLSKFIDYQIVDSLYGSGLLSDILQKLNVDRQNCQEPNRIISQKEVNAN